MASRIVFRFRGSFVSVLENSFLEIGRPFLIFVL